MGQLKIRFSEQIDTPETGSVFQYQNDYCCTLWSISPVSTVIFQKSETAMLSSPKWSEIDISQHCPQSLLATIFRTLCSECSDAGSRFIVEARRVQSLQAADC